MYGSKDVTRGLLQRVVRSFRRHGGLHVARTACRILLDATVVCWYYRVLQSRRRFAVGTHQLSYFFHPYNHTWRNERCVEVPFVLDWIKTAAPTATLEVGNVLSHYVGVDHEVLDKYEPGAGVLNLDVMDYCPPKKYDLIVTISTLEHVGWDESPRDPGKAPAAVLHLLGLLREGGNLVLTVPLGHNPYLDDFLVRGDLPFSEAFVVELERGFNCWEVARRGKLGQALVPRGKAVLLGVITRSEAMQYRVDGPHAR